MGVYVLDVYTMEYKEPYILEAVKKQVNYPSSKENGLVKAHS